MSLDVSVHQRDPQTGTLGPDLLVAPGGSRAGFESWRASVYGADAVRRRAPRFLPQLACADLLVEGDDLIPFKADCERLIGDMEALAVELGTDAERLRFRLSNLASVAEQAILAAGVVWIS